MVMRENDADDEDALVDKAREGTKEVPAVVGLETNPWANPDRAKIHRIKRDFMLSSFELL
jgi:hypothetical protein